MIIRRQHRTTIFILIVCLSIYAIIDHRNASMMKNLLSQLNQTNWQTQMTILNDHTHIINSSTNHDQESKQHEKFSDYLTKAEEEEEDEEEKDEDEDKKEEEEKSEPSLIDDFVKVISQFAGISRNNKMKSSMKETLKSLSRVPKLPSGFAEAANQKDRRLSTVVPPIARIMYNKTWRGFRLPVISCNPMGRLGNKMGEYATLYALHQIYNVSIVLNERMKNVLRDFQHISLPKLPGTFNKSEWSALGYFGSLYNYSPVELAAAGLLGPRKFIMKDYAIEIQLFQHYRKELKKEFTFSDDIYRKIREFFDTVRTNMTHINRSDLVFVGIHIRRTDYVEHAKNMFGATLPGQLYFNRSFEYYRKKFSGKVAFVAASDDRNFLKEAVAMHPDVHLSPGTSVISDMAMLASCNHSIVTMGSFGFWTGFLTGGEVVYPDVRLKREYRFSRAMYEKIGLKSFTPLPVD